MRLAQHRLPLMLLGLGLASCVSRAEIEEIKKNQKDILAKLDQIQKAGPARPAPRRPAGPDPTKTYSFPAADSPIRGEKDAWVTIIEVSDFQ